MVTMHVNRSWDAVKGVALDQTTDHADYVQVADDNHDDHDKHDNR